MDYYYIYKKYIEPKDKEFRKILFNKLRTNKVDSNIRRFLWNPYLIK